MFKMKREYSPFIFLVLPNNCAVPIARFGKRFASRENIIDHLSRIQFVDVNDEQLEMKKSGGECGRWIASELRFEGDGRTD